jgi:hypothetical protein
MQDLGTHRAFATCLQIACIVLSTITMMFWKGDTTLVFFAVDTTLSYLLPSSIFDLCLFMTFEVYQVTNTVYRDVLRSSICISSRTIDVMLPDPVF